MKLLKIYIFQICISICTVMNASSDLRHSFTTRLLFTVIPATWYASKDASIRGLTEALANDLTDLFQTGIPVDMPDVPSLNY